MTDDLGTVRRLDDLEETRKALGAADNEACVSAAKRVVDDLELARRVLKAKEGETCAQAAFEVFRDALRVRKRFV